MVFQNTIFIHHVHLKFSQFFKTIFRSERQIYFKKIIIILSWRSNLSRFLNDQRVHLQIMFFSRCVNWDILGIKTFITPCHYRCIKKCTEFTFGRRRKEQITRDIIETLRFLRLSERNVNLIPV